ncbi:MAG: hypothetical protein KDD04_10495, partial [Sinomicrobium sp.]|nr:hypothetical protein [Sinomicrobium sp.]
MDNDISVIPIFHVFQAINIIHTRTGVHARASVVRIEKNRLENLESLESLENQSAAATNKNALDRIKKQTNILKKNKKRKNETAKAMWGVVSPAAMVWKKFDRWWKGTGMAGGMPGAEVGRWGSMLRSAYFFIFEFFTIEQYRAKSSYEFCGFAFPEHNSNTFWKCKGVRVRTFNFLLFVLVSSCSLAQTLTKDE